MSDKDQNNNPLDSEKKKNEANDNNKEKSPFQNYNKNDNKDNKDKNDNSFNSVIMRNLFIFGILMVVFVASYFMFEEPFSDERRISFSQYQQILADGQIKSAVINKSQLNDFEFHGKTKEPVTIYINNTPESISKFVTKLGVVDSATETLWSQYGISWEYRESSNSIGDILMMMLPWILIIVFFVFILSRMQQGGGIGGGKGLFSFGKSKAKLLDNEKSKKVTFADVAGIDEAKVELEEVIEFLKEPDKFTKLGAKIPRGVLLLGPPGTGKTLLARAVAGEADVPFFTISGADFVEMFVGVGASRVRDLFEQAETNAPCIVFIDEIDAVGRRRGAGLGGGHDEREQTLNQLLVEMDGFEQNNGIIIIAATNRPDVLDPALLRPGRFDRQVVVDRPDVKGREGIFAVHIKKVPVAEDVDLSTLAKGTPGLSGAEIANIVNEAAINAARRNSEKVTMLDFEQSKDKVLMGVERRSLVISDKEKERTAYHEMGHALAGKLLEHSDQVHKVSIIPRGRALGITWSLPSEEYLSKSKDYFEDALVVFMAGRAAEKLVFNVYTTGASNDLERATELARKMVCDWGMSEKLGPVTFAHQQEDVFLGRDISQPKDHSEKTQQEIDEEVRKTIINAAERAEKLLVDNLELLHKASKILLEREIIDGEDLDILLDGGELSPISKQKMTALRNINLNSKNDNTYADNTADDNIKSEAKTE